MTSKEELISFFENIDPEKKALALDTIEEYCYFTTQLSKLRAFPLIQVSKKNPANQRQTPAAKLLKEYSQVVDAKRNTLLRIINSQENSAADELLAKLSEFE